MGATGAGRGRRTRCRGGEADGLAALADREGLAGLRSRGPGDVPGLVGRDRAGAGGEQGEGTRGRVDGADRAGARHALPHRRRWPHLQPIPLPHRQPRRQAGRGGFLHPATARSVARDGDPPEPLMPRHDRRNQRSALGAGAQASQLCDEAIRKDRITSGKSGCADCFAGKRSQ